MFLLCGNLIYINQRHRLTLRGKKKIWQQMAFILNNFRERSDLITILQHSANTSLLSGMGRI